MHSIKMNTLLIVLVAVVGFCYFGENKCPKVLKDNKEMLLGVLVGLALCSFMSVNLEGISESTKYAFPDCPSKDKCHRGYLKGCIGYGCQHDDDCNMCGHIDNEGKAIPNICVMFGDENGTCQVGRG